MPNFTQSISPLISFLEETTDPAVAYFSFAADATGERGVIHANKEGLRLYALELLKKARQMEEKPESRHLCFEPHEWLVSDAGYDLISAVQPEYKSRALIMAGKSRDI